MGSIQWWTKGMSWKSVCINGSKTFLAVLLQQYVVQMVPFQTLETEVAITIRPKHGMHCILSSRTN